MGAGRDPHLPHADNSAADDADGLVNPVPNSAAHVMLSGGHKAPVGEVCDGRLWDDVAQLKTERKINFDKTCIQ
ncbi:hypothetical protein RRG08_040730 [Elysia crispata]|uniref:Uncharacterized protein n=1 Tax=Elysia crispata TaxID=231223 RepID=A0AAE1BF14_9GAST|nr:hypothetical protein RRG08_040730 [Elysia crispata]